MAGSTSGTLPKGDFAHPPIRKVSVDDSHLWLAAAWRDMRRAPALSLGWGAVFAVIGYGLVFGLVAAGLGSLVLPLAAGFLLVGPVAAVGLYETSRRLERGERPSLRASLGAYRVNGGQIANLGLILMLAFYAWVQVSLLLFMFFFNASPPSLDSFVADIVFRLDSVPFLLVGTAVGGTIAAVVFAISVVSLPMLLDRDVSAVTAIATSVAACRANWRVMVGWAAMIVLIVGVGMALFFVGLAVALPLVGHATWHAYRAMVA